MPDLRFALSAQIIESQSSAISRFINCHVQVWRGQEHLTTYQLLEIADFKWPDGLDPVTVEQWAAIATRILARMVEEHTYARIQTGSLLFKEAIREEFPDHTVEVE